MNILYFFPYQFEPDWHGNRSTVKNYIKRLNDLGHNVHYVTFYENDCNAYSRMLPQVKTIDTIPQKKFDKTMIKEDGNWKFDSAYTNGSGECIKILCEKYKIDIVICSYVMFSKMLEYVPEGTLKIIDTHDKMTNRHLLMKKNHISDEFYSCTQEDEKKYLDRADIIWARRKEETDFFNKITNSKKCITVSHFLNVERTKIDFKELKTIGFVASKNNINFDMALNFLTKVIEYNQLNKTFNFNIYIAGEVESYFKSSKEKKFRNVVNYYYKFFKRKDKLESNIIKSKIAQIKKTPFIKFFGRVENISEFYEKCDLIVVPTTVGTGINVKMVEAMAYGLPVISTECGIKGMDSDNKLHHCKNIDEMIEQIIRLTENDNLLPKLAEYSVNTYKKFQIKSYENFDTSLRKGVQCE